MKITVDTKTLDIELLGLAPSDGHIGSDWIASTLIAAANLLYSEPNCVHGCINIGRIEGDDND